MQVGQERQEEKDALSQAVEKKEPIEYKKICKNPKCGKEFISTSRNTRYCSQECCDYCQQINNKKQKVRRRKRKEYDKNREINRALSATYSVAHKVADLFQIPKVCNKEAHGYTDECSGALELHHVDGNPFNNSPSNLEYICRHHHSMADDEHENVNVVDTYNKCVDEAGFEDDDKKHIKMIKVFEETVKGEGYENA